MPHMEASIVARCPIVEGTGPLEGLTAIEEEGIVETDMIGQARSPVERSGLRADLHIGVPETLGDVGLEEADLIEEETILQAEGPGLLGIVMRDAPLIRHGIEADDLCDTIPEIATVELEVQCPKEGVAESKLGTLGSTQIFFPSHDAVLVLIASERRELAEVGAIEADGTIEAEGMAVVGVESQEERGEDIEVALEVLQTMAVVFA